MFESRAIYTLLQLIKKNLNLVELFDVNFNMSKRDELCPDCIISFLKSFKSPFSLYAKLLNTDTNYKVTVFYHEANSKADNIQELHFTPANVEDFYLKLDDYDFFNDSDLFAIAIENVNGPYFVFGFPEIFVYAIT